MFYRSTLLYKAALNISILYVVTTATVDTVATDILESIRWTASTPTQFPHLTTRLIW